MDNTVETSKRTSAPILDPRSHPLYFLQMVAKECPTLRSFELISYDVNDGHYGDTATADKETHEVDASAIVEVGSEIIREAAKDNLDVVVSSRVTMKDDNEVYHMPMFDLSVPKILSYQNLHQDEVFLNAFAIATGMEFQENFALFESGRSYHAYGMFRSKYTLLGEQRWCDFMMQLLTLPGLHDSIPAVESVADFRWIGHRMLKGFAALRLSAVDKHYLQEPAMVYCPTGQVRSF